MNLRAPRLWMVFDVESVGLHGEGFAVGFVVVDGDGRELTCGRFSCDPINASGDYGSREWVAKNVPLMRHNCEDPDGMRECFWNAWLRWKEAGAALAADVPWPVEARFLNHCVQADPEAREWGGPYPLIDVASVRLAAGFDPLGTEPRRENELPAHDPLNDARQSARLLSEAFARLESLSCSSS